MGIQLKLTGVTFNSSDLPVLPTYGFSDDFNRADASTLGPGWHVEAGSGAAVQGIAGNQAFVGRASAAGPAFATMDANLADCTVETKVTVIDGGGPGLVLRAESITNYIRLTNSGYNYRLEKVVDNVTTNVWTSPGAAAAVGDVMTAIMNGPNIAVYANGELLTTQTIAEHTTNTRHGIYNNSGAGVRFDYCTARSN